MAEHLILHTSRKNEVVDITDTLTEHVRQINLKEGLLHVFVTHTTCAVTTADLDPGTDMDMLDAFNEMVPNLNYRHPHNPKHVGDHIMASLIGPTVVVPIEEWGLKLGTWQRVVLIEFDGPRERTMAITPIKGN